VEQEATSNSEDWIRATSADFIDAPDLYRLFEYWCSKRRGRLMPAMADIDPVEIAWSLSRIYLLDYTASQEFIYRLAGNEVAGIFGRANLKGLQPRDFLPAERAALVEQRFRRIVEERCILWMKGLIYLRADRTSIGERLVLPLSDSGGDGVTGLLGMSVIDSTPPGPADAPDRTQEYYLPVAELP